MCSFQKTLSVQRIRPLPLQLLTIIWKSAADQEMNESDRILVSTLWPPMGHSLSSRTWQTNSHTAARNLLPLLTTKRLVTSVALIRLSSSNSKKTVQNNGQQCPIVTSPAMMTALTLPTLFTSNAHRLYQKSNLRLKSAKNHRFPLQSVQFRTNPF